MMLIKQKDTHEKLLKQQAKDYNIKIERVQNAMKTERAQTDIKYEEIKNEINEIKSTLDRTARNSPKEELNAFMREIQEQYKSEFAKFNKELAKKTKVTSDYEGKYRQLKEQFKKLRRENESLKVNRSASKDRNYSKIIDENQKLRDTISVLQLSLLKSGRTEEVKFTCSQCKTQYRANQDLSLKIKKVKTNKNFE